MEISKIPTSLLKRKSGTLPEITTTSAKIIDDFFDDSSDTVIIGYYENSYHQWINMEIGKYRYNTKLIIAHPTTDMSERPFYIIYSKE